MEQSNNSYRLSGLGGNLEHDLELDSHTTIGSITLLF